MMTMLLLTFTVTVIFPSSVKAEATKTYFTITDYGGSITDPRTVTYLPSGVVLMRGERTSGVWQESSDPRYTGYRTHVLNANLGKDGAGPCWGTLTVEVVGRGSWEGTFTGWVSVRDETASIRLVAHGRGVLEGLKIFVTWEYPNFVSGTGIGYILEPDGA